jgi:hypothetical protein
MTMNLLDWVQVVFSLVVMLIGLYIAFSRGPRRGGAATTRVGGVGVALLGLSYFVGGFEGPAVETPLLVRVEVYSGWWGYWWCSGPCSHRRAGGSLRMSALQTWWRLRKAHSPGPSSCP